eukprot:TRINITY_DN6657_c0_g1_i1.p1 TRINITY_DN6657_c0_g1~~TRINITY_DN6657_c0_g1_i1.p1  ORF type:complete len:291 (-),score=40.28 TRINITY_DN6657_c0_g1_i1:9-881(-)
MDGILTKHKGPSLLVVLSFLMTLWDFFNPKFVRMYFSLMPLHTLPPNFFLWNLLSYPFVHSSVVVFGVDALLLFYFWSKLKPIWGVKEMFVMFLFVSVASGIVMIIELFMLVPLFGTSVLYSPSGGLTAFVSALIVGIKQNFATTEIGLEPVKLRGSSMPGVFVLMNFLFAFFDFFAPIHALTGMLTSWIYLRWYQLNDGTRGDLSDEFSFASFFPEFLQPFAKSFSRVIQKLFCNCLKKTSEEIDELEIPLATVFGNPNAERLRKIGELVIEERLKKKQTEKEPETEIP